MKKSASKAKGAASRTKRSAGSQQRMVMAKRAIKKKYPKAYAYRYAGAHPWVIYSGEYPNRALNVSDKSQRAAWEAARP